MTSIIKLQAFSGVEDESPPCYLLQVDEFRFLLDCGWDEDFNMSYIDNIKRHVHQVDAVLLSFPDAAHLGALPYLVGHCGLACPVYATIPVYKMGQMFMYDAYQSRHNVEDFSLFTLDDVDAAFDKIVQLKYSQTVALKGKGHGLQITPLQAGHMIGGTLWKIVKDGEEEIVYAVDYNHKKERHLNGCTLDSLQRPFLLITDALNADYVQPRRRNRDEQLMNTVLHTMRSNGNCLVVVDTAGRVLELAQMLEDMWRRPQSGLSAYNIALLNNVAFNVIEFAKSQVEWMSDKILRSFEDHRNNPFQFKHIQLCHNVTELSRIPEPKVVLAGQPGLQSGFARELFLSWAAQPENTVILTNKTPPGTLTRRLIDHPDLRSMTVEVRQRVKLEGEELAEHQRVRERERAAERARQEQEDKNRQEPEVSSSESEDEADQGHVKKEVKVKHDLMVTRQETRSKTSGFFKRNKVSHVMFPFAEDKLKWDDYGEIIRTADFLLPELEAPAEKPAPVTRKPVIPMEEERSEVPTKCTRTKLALQIQAKVVHIEFEGRSDGESIRKLLTQVKPRNLILVRGRQDSTQGLAEFCRERYREVLHGQGTVYTPQLGEVVDATKETHIYQVRLKDSVVSALSFSRAKEAEVAWVDVQLDLAAPDGQAGQGRPAIKEEGMEVDEDEDSKDVVPTVLPVPKFKAPGHKAVFINEPRLTDFKQLLQRQGVRAEFQGGVLICNNCVAVRRTETGRMLLEGTVSDDYYKVRKLLYDQFAII